MPFRRPLLLLTMLLAAFSPPQTAAAQRGPQRPAPAAPAQPPPPAPPAPTTPAPAPPPAAASDPDCALRLADRGVTVQRAEAPAPAAPGCGIVDPVRLLAVADPGGNGRRIRFPERPLLSCAMAGDVARFAAEIAAPLARGVFGRELAAISTGPGYECRTRNRQPGAKVSSHGRGDAVDVGGVELAGGRRVVVAPPATPEAQRFYDGLRAAGCGVFTTVLGPGSDAAHGDHLHLDREARGRDGRSKFCQ